MRDVNMSKREIEASSLENLGIVEPKKIFYNLSYEQLFKHETDESLMGNEKAMLTEFGAVNVDTGRFTGRSPKDKYIVEEENSRNNIWWSGTGSDNQKLSEKNWQILKSISIQQLNKKKLYVMDGFCGANLDTRMNVRLITEIAWMAHFFKNMFIRPSQEELKNFSPHWTILNACKATCKNFKDYSMHSEVFVAFNIKEKMTVIGGTWYGGENKKGI